MMTQERKWVRGINYKLWTLIGLFVGMFFTGGIWVATEFKSAITLLTEIHQDHEEVSRHDADIIVLKQDVKLLQQKVYTANDDETACLVMKHNNYNYFINP